MPDLRCTDTEGEGAERPVCACVAIAADNRLARLGGTKLRPDDVHDATLCAVEAVQLYAEVGAVLFHLPATWLAAPSPATSRSLKLDTGVVGVE